MFQAVFVLPAIFLRKYPPTDRAHASRGIRRVTVLPSAKQPKRRARDAKVQGTVIVEGVVGLDGRITHLRIVKALGWGLDESALKALKKWKCSPALDPNGKPIPTNVPFEIQFEPH